MEKRLTKTIERWGADAKMYAGRLSPALILAVIHKESRGNPEAKNIKSGATGLMQITQPALTDFNKAKMESWTLNDLFDPQKNIRVGAWYLNWLWTTFGTGTKANLSPEQMLRAYNWGIGKVLKNVTPIPQEALEYPEGVLSYFYQISTDEKGAIYV